MKKIKVGAVSYLNTKPLLYGIKHHKVQEEIELFEGYPSSIAQMLLQNEVDVGLVPVAIIPRLKEYYIITDYCIGADGPVASVCLFSDVPMEEIQTIYLDYQSRTSVNMAKLLLKEYWKKEVQFIDATNEGYIDQIKGTTAGVVIGDRALIKRASSKYIYDLAEAWISYTNLPFVFAAWIANKQIPAEFINGFNKANALGVANIDVVIKEISFPQFNLANYYKEHISYDLTEEKRRGLACFLNFLNTNFSQI